MKSHKQNISKEKIELEIYNTFERFKKEKNILIAEFLNKSRIECITDHDYRTIKFTYDSLVRLIIFKKIKKIRFQNQLHQYLKSHPEETILLGLIEIPDRRTVGYFLHHILNNEQRKLIDFIVSKIEEVSEKFGILFDIQTLEPKKPKKITKKRNQDIQRKKNTKEVCKLIKKRFSPFIDFKLRHNTIYQKNQFIDLMIHMGMTRDFAENGSKTLRELREDRDLTQKDVAKLLDTTQSYYAKYERGELPLPLARLKILCMFYGVSADYILGLPKNLKWPR